ncbi:hypothetical protein OS493_009983 [Desmophyllum pertusum]|uniref:receptor protein-tyrosine kinase n=1 Tax=Desmophyllum pertusum TaxID=174260 RepID=A0A9X0CFB3_9CNID|nr:hypothetical protein OS493_009983 [Desmophyllum pertusum]
MVNKATVVFLLSLAVLGHLPQSLCWKREENSIFFDGAVFLHRNFALETDILRKVKTSGEVHCGLACLSEKDCIAQTYCAESWAKTKGTCYLHKNGIKDEQTTGVLVRREECTYQQYINFYEASCSRQCHNGNRCSYDYDNRRYACRCEPPCTAIQFRFTTLGMQGNSGPTSTAGYVNTTLKGAVTLHNGIQIWTVPFTALYELTVAGASGGDTSFSGGKGAIVNGSVHLTKGTELHLLIGQKGLKGTGQNVGAGGGGGTFVVFSNNTLLAAAGGGGGPGGQITAKNGDNGQTSRNGSVYGGVNGLGGSVCADEVSNAGGGGGFKGDGKCSTSIMCTFPRKCNQGGLSYLNGGLGGSGNGIGGFGGGGAADKKFPGGGGGYSGGGVYASSYTPKGGGGGSYYTGEMKPSNEVNAADGYVLIDFDGSLL